MRALGGFTVMALLAALVTTPAHAEPSPRCPVDLPGPINGNRAVEALASDLAEAASAAGMPARELRQTLREDRTLWLDSCARPFYIEPSADDPRPLFEPALDTTGDALALHSRPGSKRTLFLDFDGHEVENSAWADEYGEFTAPPYSTDSDPAFSEEELARIADVWLRVAEDYAAFDVDVTTEDPGDAAIERSGAADDTFGTRVAIVDSDNPVYEDCDCGGVAYLDVFDEYYDHAYFQPAFVFTHDDSSTKFMGEAASHEAGHNFALRHDGQGLVTTYYRGQGVWAPIMGVGYYRPLSQWSKGEYTNANNKENDLALIAENGAPYLTDDVPDSREQAADLDPGSTSAMINTAADTDWFRFEAQDLTTIIASPQNVSANLDVRLDLYDEDGTLLASADPPSDSEDADVAEGLDATITQVLPKGTYFVKTDGVGNGSATSTGYTDYSSIGRYDLTLITGATGTPTVTQQVLPTGAVDADYSATFTATGGTAPYSFDVSDGSLPAGLSLAADGQLTGVPATAGTYPFTVRVADDLNATGTAQFTITIDPKPAPPEDPKPPPTQPPVTPTSQPPTPPTPTTPTPTPSVTITPVPISQVAIVSKRRLPRATVGKRYVVRLRAENAVHWRIATGKAPRGLRLNSAGVLSGRAKKAGRFRLTITATGSAGQATVGVFSIRVVAAKR